MADYNTIIDAIDTAITNWVGEPAQISEAGRSVTYRSLSDLVAARRMYAKLANTARNGRGFTISRIKSSGARG